MFDTISGLIANNKALRIVALAIPNGIRAYDHFKLVANTDQANKVKVLPGIYVHGSFIVQLLSEVVLEGFTTPSSGTRTDVVYVDVTSDTDTPVITFAQGQVDPPANDAVHTYFPLWRIARSVGVDNIDNTVALGYPGGVINNPTTPSPYDRREIPSEFAPHNHALLQGATDVTATFQDVNHVTGLQVIDPLGGTQKVTAARLLDLCASTATGDNLSVLVSGATTTLHKHDASVQGIQLPNGDVINPATGRVIYALDGWDQVTLTKTGGNKMTLFIPIGVKNPMDVDLDAASHAIKNLANPVDNGDAVNKGTLDTLLALRVLYTGAAHDLQMAGHQVKDLANGTADQDAVTVSQLATAIAGVIGGGLDLLDKRYKLGGVDASCINGNNPGKEAAGPVNMNTFIIHKLGDCLADEDAVNKRKMIEAINAAVATLTSLINGRFPHNLTDDHVVTKALDMNGQRITNAGGPSADLDLVTKAWVIAKLAELMPAPYEGDNLGNHTCIQALNFNGHQGINLADPGSEPGDAVNKRYADAIRTALELSINHLAKLGDFATRANSERLPISTKLGGSLDIKGKTDQTLFYVGPDTLGNDVIYAGARIEYVGTPVKPNDAVTKAYVDTNVVRPGPWLDVSPLTTGWDGYLRVRLMPGNMVYISGEPVPNPAQPGLDWAGELPAGIPTPTRTNHLTIGGVASSNRDAASEYVMTLTKDSRLIQMKFRYGDGRLESAIQYAKRPIFLNHLLPLD